MPAGKIMIIRHAEKPSDDGTIQGVAKDGTQNKEELTVRGWQRAGALVRFFNPRNGDFPDPRLAKPAAIFAAAVGAESMSLRPQHTILPLAKSLGKDLILTHPQGAEDAVAKDAVDSTGVVLIAWEHKRIHLIANAIVGDTTTCPQKWPGERFDLVWIFDRTGAGRWNFSQVPQLLLPGDESSVA